MLCGLEAVTEAMRCFEAPFVCVTGSVEGMDAVCRFAVWGLIEVWVLAGPVRDTGVI